MDRVDPGENPDRWVRENRDMLVRIIKHGDARFVRAAALATLVRYGDDPALHEVERELKLAKEVMG